MKGDGEYTDVFEEACNKISDSISNKMKNAAEEEVKITTDTIGDFWHSGESFLSCEPCMKFKNSDDVPAPLKKVTGKEVLDSLIKSS